MTLSEIRRRGLEVSGIIFNGEAHPSTENIIKKIGQVEEIGRIDQEAVLDKKVIRKYAGLFKKQLEAL